MKNTRLDNCWTTFFNLLVENERTLVKFAGNEDLVDDIVKCAANFPVHKAMMRKNIFEGINGRKSLDDALNVLSSILPIFNPTHLVIWDILKDLSEED